MGGLFPRDKNEIQILEEDTFLAQHSSDKSETVSTPSSNDSLQSAGINKSSKLILLKKGTIKRIVEMSPSEEGGDTMKFIAANNKFSLKASGSSEQVVADE